MASKYRNMHAGPPAPAASGFLFNVVEDQYVIEGAHGLAVTRAFGDRQFKRGRGGRGSGVVAEPAITTLVAPVGGVLVLCSDGLTDTMTPADIAALLPGVGGGGAGTGLPGGGGGGGAAAAGGREPGKVAEQLVQMARARGSSDDITAVVICL